MASKLARRVLNMPDELVGSGPSSLRAKTFQEDGPDGLAHPFCEKWSSMHDLNMGTKV